MGTDSINIDYIEKHLTEDITIEKLAEIAALSPFYYQRLFKRLVKKPVFEYIKLRRMAKATEMLLKEDMRILDVAMDLGFTSHEHFTRSFKEAFGVTPEEYRKKPEAMNRMTKPELLLNYTLVDEGVPLITEGIVLEVNRCLIKEPINFIGLNKKMPVSFMGGLGTESSSDPLDGLWNNVHDKKVKTWGISDDTEELGVAYPSSEQGYFNYFAGTKFAKDVDDNGCTTWQLPIGEYVVCKFEAENFEALVMDALYKAEGYIYNTWLPSRNIKTDLFCAERYASHSPETKSMEVWLKILK